MSLIIIPKPAADRDLHKSSDYSQDLKNDGSKVPFDKEGKMAGGLNFASNDRQIQLIEMQAHLNLCNNKDAKPLQHLVFSYSAGIRPTRQQVTGHIQEYLKTLGIPDSFVLYDCHENTKNFHVHVLLDRLAKEPDKKGQYRIADAGEFKVTSKEKTKSGKVKTRTRTDESICRQVTIARVCGQEGWEPPRLTHDHLGKPIQQTKDKDGHSQKTVAGERKTGKKSKERQLSELLKEVFDQAAFESSTTKESFWSVADREFSEKAIQMVLNLEDGKPVGGFIQGPGNRKCSFSRAGKEYSMVSLVKKYGLPKASDSACINELQPFEYSHQTTKEELKKQLIPLFKQSESWQTLITNTEIFGTIQRSGGGLIFSYNNGQDSIKFSEIGNKFSLSKLEKAIGPCPLPKTKADAQEENQVNLLKYLAEQSVPLSLQEVPTLSQIPLFSQIKLNITRGYHYVASIIGIQQPEPRPEPKQPEQQPEPTKQPEQQPKLQPEPRPEPKQPRPTPKPTRPTPTRPEPSPEPTKQPEPSPSPGPSNTRNVLERHSDLPVKSELDQKPGTEGEFTENGNGPR